MSERSKASTRTPQMTRYDRPAAVNIRPYLVIHRNRSHCSSSRQEGPPTPITARSTMKAIPGSESHARRVPLGKSRSQLSGSSLPEKMEESAELPVRVPLAGGEFRGEYVLGVISGGTVPCPGLREEADAVPGHRIDATASKKRTQLVGIVGAGLNAEPVDLPLSVERRQDTLPVVLIGGAHGKCPSVLGDDRDDAPRTAQHAQGAHKRRWVLDVHQHAMTQHTVESTLTQALWRTFAVNLDEANAGGDVARLPRHASSRLVEHDPRRVGDCEVVPSPGQLDRLMTRTAPDVDDLRGWWREMAREVVVQHKDADLAVQARVVLDELARHGVPSGVAHPRILTQESVTLDPRKKYVVV